MDQIVNKCSESDKQEKEEVASPTSSVDYYYTEEDEDEEDEDGKEPISDPESEDSGETRAKKRNKFAAVSRPELQDWVDSWKVINHPALFVWVNVYAYYNMGKGYGGYGVILRDFDAKPITASAKFSADGVSFFTQVMMGVKAGLTIAKKKHKLSELCVRCNSIKVPGLIYRIINCRNDECTRTGGPSFCKWCLEYVTLSEGCEQNLVPHLLDIKALLGNGQHLQDLIEFPRDMNEAAYFLAKTGRKNGLKVENNTEKNTPGHEEPIEIEPDNFSPELKEILWNDAFDMMYYNVGSRKRVTKRVKPSQAVEERDQFWSRSNSLFGEGCSQNVQGFDQTWKNYLSSYGSGVNKPQALLIIQGGVVIIIIRWTDQL